VVVNSETKAAIVHAKAAFVTANSTSFQLANLNGEISDIPYFDTLRISSVGFDTLILTTKDYEILDHPKILELNPSTLFDEVVVTAQYEPVLANRSIQKIRIITTEQIERSGSNNLADILTYQAGIRLSQDNVLGSFMSLGGLSGQNVKILMDGVPVIGRLDGNIDLSQINLNNIERIEIVEGPLSVNYGTNALAGTINLISKKQNSKSFSITVNPYYESIGNYNLSGALGLKIKKHQFRFSAGRNYFDGWSANDPFFQFPKSRLADTNRFKTWKPKEQYFGEIRYSTQFKEWQISPYFRYFDELITNRGLPNAPYYEIGIDDYYHTIRQDAGFNISKKWKKSRFNSILAYNHFARHKNTYVKDLTTLEQSLSEAEGAQDTSVFNLLNWRLTYNHKLHRSLTMEVGTDITYETAVGRRIENQFQDQTEYALYTTFEWEPFEDFKLKPGIRYGYNTNYPAPITPSLNLFYKLRKFQFRGSIARGFRAPTLKELYFDFVDINHNIQGNTGLESEFSYNYSAGITWMSAFKKKYLFKVDYSFFYNDIDNLITLGAIDNNEFTYVNIGKFKSIGNQLSFDVKAKRFNLGISANLIGRYNRFSADELSVKPFAFSPEIASNASFEVINKKLRLNVFYKYNGPLSSFGVNSDEEIVENRQDGYSILDATISAYFFDQDLQLTIGAKNLLNVREVNVTGLSGGVHSGGGNLNAARGISTFIGLKYNFNHDFKKKD